MRLIQRLSFFILLSYTACSKYEGTSSTSAGEISGVVQAGRVSDATVKVFKIKDGARDELLAESKTDSEGNYSVGVSPSSDPIEVVASGGSYRDEATGETVKMESGDELSVILEDTLSAKSAPVTPITTQVRDRVMAQLESKNITMSQFATAKDAALDEVAQAYGTDRGPIMAIPSKPENPGSGNEAKGAYLLATLSQYLKDKNLSPVNGVNPFDALKELSKDLKNDGKLDGKDSGIPVSSSFSTLCTGWSAGMSQAADNLKTNGNTQGFNGLDKSNMGIGQFKNQPENKMNAVSSSAQAQAILCHIPPGNPENKHTITIGDAGVAAHLAHGDYRGECLTVPAPIISSFAPPSGIPGTVITITGSDFTGASSVLVHGTGCSSFAISSATQITCTIASGTTTGTISVTTSGGTATSYGSGSEFTMLDYTPQGPWTWVSGGNSGGEIGVYGIKGVAASTNVPGSRLMASSVTDSSGNLWLFGGVGVDSAGSEGHLNDLWKYNGSDWVWISGGNTRDPIGIYGTKGVASSSNYPGGRSRAAYWIDSSNNFWLFGGEGSDSVATNTNWNNDLWKFDGTNWTWVSGNNVAVNSGQNTINNAGIYGSKGTPSSLNLPGPRNRAVSWIDSTNNLWLFGGYGLDANGEEGLLNDLWKFNGSHWTWLSGSNLRGQSGSYGTKGVAASSNTPGERQHPITWVDSSQNLWLFGGYGRDSSDSSGYLNDLWKFDGTNWAWISGSKFKEQYGSYGTQGIAASSNVPGARTMAAGWVDSSGNLWIFGGYGKGTTSEKRLNDLWKFNGTNWTWVSGNTTTNNHLMTLGTYGTKGTGSVANFPGGRDRFISWKDAAGNFWLFGGIGGASANESSAVYLNDLWKYTP